MVKNPGNSGVAIQGHSPAQMANATESVKESGDSKKIIIKESQLKEIVREAVRCVLSEGKKEKYGPNGYRIVKGGMDYTVNGEKRHSAISVIDRSGGQSYHVDEDDHCYVFYATWKGKTELYQYPYIFDELLDAIKMLPKPE